jgi:hypothetical protein
VDSWVVRGPLAWDRPVIVAKELQKGTPSGRFARACHRSLSRVLSLDTTQDRV